MVAARRSRLFGVVVACLATALLAVALVDRAEAASKYRYYSYAGAELKIDDRHRAYVEVYGRDALVSVLRKGAGNAQVTYRVRARMKKNRVQADLGSIGKLDLKVIRATKWKKASARKSCPGKMGQERFVRFRTKLRYRGEDGSFNYRGVTRKHPSFVVQYRNHTKTCTWEHGQYEDDYQWPSEGHELLLLKAVSGQRQVHVMREGYIHSTVHWLLVDQTSVGKVKATRLVYGFDRAPVFEIDEDQGLGVLDPLVIAVPGTATFTRTDGLAGTWLGDLRAVFPGTAETTFAGEGFEAWFGPYAAVSEQGPSLELLGGRAVASVSGGAQ